ncbi:cytosolic carboxypeptidase 2 isoform X1 [Erpetoichthys calabaricus]|uniref:cytosolic carboxypeptidase 2 isoform X1 n=1 Tax=Erpetoichthys calabaricus TaxID=27687 RepID=UPI002234D1C0|nr:cytosolic carboxypeptidase 2 isoform X1 [Erpetoichthys calabaricus]
MCPTLETSTPWMSVKDPYETFMQQHLQHYGLFTGRNAGYQRTFESVPTWEKHHDYLLSENISVDSNDSDTGSSSKQEETKGKHYSFLLEQDLFKTRQLVFDFHEGKKVPRLREPRSLFAVPSLSAPNQKPRWPLECEVIKDEICHIDWKPPEPEPFYQVTGYEKTPMCVGEGKGNVVYCIDPATKSPYFTCSRAGGSRGPIKDATVFVKEKDGILLFESRFESGNLQKAVRVGLNDYELTLQTDLYTNKHTQWFYFRVQNMKPGITYRFTIINLMKSNSLYNMGMKPLMYSETDALSKKIGWRRVGSEIRYYKNQSLEGLHSLTWTCQFPNQGDTCYFAHCYPYTYTDLQRYLNEISNDSRRSQYCTVRSLCRSLAGNTVYVLTITSPFQNAVFTAAKKAVVVTARVHPGETNSSWMMKGFLDFILGDSHDAEILRNMFIFKVVPMLNPDGVIVGNYRCSLTGRDLNRNYKTILQNAFPCVWHTRNMVKRLLSEREVILYCDFHGHSRKNNVFMYGCDNKNSPSMRLQERIFPLMMSKNAADQFSYKSCKFRVQKSKEGTGRIVMWRLGIVNSYTMESTFSGSTLGNRKGTHFTTEDLKSLGYHFCDTLLDFCDPDQTKSRNIKAMLMPQRQFSQCLTEIGERLEQEILSKMERLGKEMNHDTHLSDVELSDIESSTSGSNSSESDGLPVHLIDLARKLKQKKKKLKTRKERNKLHHGSQVRKALFNSSKTTENVSASSAKAEKSALQDRPSGDTQEKKAEKFHYTQRDRIATSRTWVSYPTTGIAVIGEVNTWNKTPEKTSYLEAVTAAYLRGGGVLSSPGKTSSPDNSPLRYCSGRADITQHLSVQPNCATHGEFEWCSRICCRHQSMSLVKQMPLQRQLLPMTSVQQQNFLVPPARERVSPLRQHPLPFDAKLETGTADQLMSLQPTLKRGRSASLLKPPSAVFPESRLPTQGQHMNVTQEWPISSAAFLSQSSLMTEAVPVNHASRVPMSQLSVKYLTTEARSPESSVMKAPQNTIQKASDVNNICTSQTDALETKPALQPSSFLPGIKKPEMTKQRLKRSNTNTSSMGDKLEGLEVEDRKPVTRTSSIEKLPEGELSATALERRSTKPHPEEMSEITPLRSTFSVGQSVPRHQQKSEQQREKTHKLQMLSLKKPAGKLPPPKGIAGTVLPIRDGNREQGTERLVTKSLSTVNKINAPSEGDGTFEEGKCRGSVIDQQGVAFPSTRTIPFQGDHPNDFPSLSHDDTPFFANGHIKAEATNVSVECSQVAAPSDLVGLFQEGTLPHPGSHFHKESTSIPKSELPDSEPCDPVHLLPPEPDYTSVRGVSRQSISTSLPTRRSQRHLQQSSLVEALKGKLSSVNLGEDGDWEATPENF